MKNKLINEIAYLNKEIARVGDNRVIVDLKEDKIDIRLPIRYLQTEQSHAALINQIREVYEKYTTTEKQEITNKRDKLIEKLKELMLKD